MDRIFPLTAALLLAAVTVFGATPIELKGLPPSAVVFTPKINATELPPNTGLPDDIHKHRILAPIVFNQGPIVLLPLGKENILIPQTLKAGARALAIPQGKRGDWWSRIIPVTRKMALALRDQLPNNNILAISTILGRTFDNASLSGPDTTSALPVVVPEPAPVSKNDSAIEELVSAGFRPIGKSGLYRKGNFFFESAGQGRLKLLFPHRGVSLGIPYLQPRNIFFVRRNEFGQAEFISKEKKIDGKDFLLSESIGHSGPFNEPLPPKIKPISQQLIDAGFRPVHGRPDLYKFTVPDPAPWTPREILVLISGNRFKFVLEDAKQALANQITDKTHILGRGLVNDGAITLANDLLRFQVSDESQMDNQLFLRPPQPGDLGVKSPKVRPEPTGFKINGVNPTTLIREIGALNGQEIHSLEQRMKPGQMSSSGFLGPSEDLRTVLAEDNDLVLGAGLTHQILAEPLKMAVAMIYRDMGLKFEYLGEHYQIGTNNWMGYQHSPFVDDTKASVDFYLTHLESAAAIPPHSPDWEKENTIFFSELLPDMIERYGFYEGIGTHYRLDPKKLLTFFAWHRRKK